MVYGHMRRSIIVITLLLAAGICQAQRKVSLTYGADFQYYFDNKEYDCGNHFDNSGTIHAARLTPMAGVKVDGGDITHSLNLGIDVMKNMGESPTSAENEDLLNEDLLRELIFWYGLETGQPGRRFFLHAGIFPRSLSAFGGQYPHWEYSQSDNIPTLFISGANRFYDNNIEGLLMKYRTRRGYCEAGLDWMGMIGHLRRERFQIFTYGNFGIGGDIFHAGWTGTMYHFANTLEYKGVVDNVIVSPFVMLTSGYRDFCWSAKLGYIQGVHQDRARETGLDLAFGGQLTVDLSYRKFGLLNDTYYGSGQMPYYDLVDAGGYLYGSDLYAGSPFYRLHESDGDWKDPGCYNRSEIYWQPYISDFVSLRLSAVFHFAGGGYQGCQQKLSLYFDLGRALSGNSGHKAKSGAARQRTFEIYL